MQVLMVSCDWHQKVMLQEEIVRNDGTSLHQSWQLVDVSNDIMLIGKDCEKQYASVLYILLKIKFQIHCNHTCTSQIRKPITDILTKSNL